MFQIEGRYRMNKEKTFFKKKFTLGAFLGLLTNVPVFLWSTSSNQFYRFIKYELGFNPLLVSIFFSLFIFIIGLIGLLKEPGRKSFIINEITIITTLILLTIGTILFSFGRFVELAGSMI